MPRAAGTLQKTLFYEEFAKDKKDPHRSSSQSSPAYSRAAGGPSHSQKTVAAQMREREGWVGKTGAHHTFIYQISMLNTNLRVKKKKEKKSNINPVRA